MLFNPFVPKRERYYYFKSTDLANLSDRTVEAIIACAHDRPVPSVLLAVWHYGGAMQRVGVRDTAPGQRRAPSVEGGEVHHLSKGDVITIPAKTPHWFKEVPTGTIAYYAVNTEP